MRAVIKQSQDIFSGYEGKIKPKVTTEKEAKFLFIIVFWKGLMRFSTNTHHLQLTRASNNEFEIEHRGNKQVYV